MGKSILIVEDEQNIVDILSFNLSREGYDTLEAYDGPTGLQLALEQDPDLILLDLMLPGMDGFEVCRQVRESGSSTPIIMLTAREEIPDKIQFVSIDVSFISLTKVLGPVKALMEPDGQVVCLIKPQFEAGREKVGKKGVVRERSVHLEVICMVAAFAGSIGFEALHLEFSPIKGPEGNIEYLLHLRNDARGNVYENSSIDAEEIVNQAHETLD